MQGMPSALLWIVLSFLGLGLSGCGGGGGGAVAPGSSTTGSGTSSGTGGSSTAASSGTVAEISGSIGLAQSTNSSVSQVSRSFSRIHFALSTVNLATDEKTSGLSSVVVEFLAIKTLANGFEEATTLGQSQTDAAGAYKVLISESRLQALSPLVESVEALYVSTVYKLRMRMVRQGSLSREVTFSPSYNGSLLGKAGKAGNLTVDAVVDFSQNQTVKLNVRDTQTIKEALARIEADPSMLTLPAEQKKAEAVKRVEQLIVQENVDLNGNGLPDEKQPLVVFARPTLREVDVNEGGTLVRKTIVDKVIQMDANGDGRFAEGEDLVPAQLFNPSAKTEEKLASFIDLQSTGRPATTDQLSVVDSRSPQLLFASPLSQRVITISTLDIELQYADDLGVDLPSLKIFSSSVIRLTRPNVVTLAPGANLAQFFTKITTSAASLITTGAGGVGLASFRLQDAAFAFGAGTHNLKAEVSDFAGKKTTAQVDFVINGKPLFRAPSASLAVEEGKLYSSEFENKIFEISDVMPIDLRLDPIPASTALNWLSMELSNVRTNGNPVILSPGSVFRVTSTTDGSNTIKIRFTGTAPQTLNNVPALRIRAIDAEQNSDEVALRIDVKQTNNDPEWLGICAIGALGSNSANLFSQDPARVCTMLSDTTLCRTPGGTALRLPEKTRSTIVVCAQDKDDEDRLEFRFDNVNFAGNSTKQSELPTKELLATTPRLIPATAMSSRPFRLIRNSVGALQLLTETVENRSSVAFFDWRPSGTYGGDNILRFTVTDGKRNSLGTVVPVGNTVTLNISTVEDSPLIVGINATGAVTDGLSYAEPLVVAQNDAEGFLNYQGTAGLPVLVNAIQGENFNLVFTGEDDETKNPQISLFSSVINLVNSSGVNLTSPWLQFKAQEFNDARKNFKLSLEGVPTNADAAKTQIIRVSTADPTNLSTPVNRSYSFALNVLDQNDRPLFSNQQSDALSLVANAGSVNIQRDVTVTLSATEDQPLTFYVHAYDIDPQEGPFFSPQTIVIASDARALKTPLKSVELLPHVAGNNYRTARVTWIPGTEDTQEDNITNFRNPLTSTLKMIADAPCPPALRFNLKCIQQKNTITYTIAVNPVDEAPKYRKLFVNNAEFREGDGSIHATRVVTFLQGDPLDIRQFVREEEAGQLVEDIRLSFRDVTLNFLSLSLAPKEEINPEGRLLRLTGVAPNTSVTYETSLINGILTPTPKVVSVIMEAEGKDSNGAVQRTFKTLSFQIFDRPDAPLFTGVAKAGSPFTTAFESRILVNEKEQLTLNLRADNSSDKDPRFRTGFFFRVKAGTEPSPLGNFSVTSSNSTSNVTGVLIWTPDQTHVNGTNAKDHAVVLQACLINAPTVCGEQSLVFSINPIDDLPRILFGEERRDLTLQPFSEAAPFLVQENQSFDRVVRILDPDGEGVSFKAEFRLASPAQVGTTAALRNSGALLTFPTEDIEPRTTIPVATVANQTVLTQTLKWSQIDWDDIGVSPSQLTTALYRLVLTATTISASSNPPTTIATVFLRLQSVNDAPRFATSTVLQIIGQNAPASSVVTDLATVVTDEEGDILSYNLVGKGTSANFVGDLASGTTLVRLSSAPGQQGVGTHVLRLQVSESNNPANLVIGDLSFNVDDDNDAPVFINSGLNSAVQKISEGQSTLATVEIFDRDLSTSPQFEKIAQTVQFSQDGITYTTWSFTQSLSQGQTIFTTSQPYFFSYTTLPPNALLGRTGLTFNFRPNSVPGFAALTFYIKFLAGDSFGTTKSVSNAVLVTSTVVGYEITPVDDTPTFISVNGSTIGTNQSVTPVCLATDCSLPAAFFLEDSVYPLISVTATNQETENLNFSFAQAFTSITTGFGLSNLSISGTTKALALTTDSALLSYSPTNVDAGLRYFTLRVNDEFDSAPGSINQTKSATHTFAFLVRNTPDAPVLRSISLKGVNYLTATTAIDVLEDQTMLLDLVIEDADSSIPKAFNTTEIDLLQTHFKLSLQKISELEKILLPSENFSYALTNAQALPGFSIQALDTTTLFAFSTPSNFIQTNTTSAVRFVWDGVSDAYTFPKIAGGNVTLGLQVRSFASNAVDSSKPTSLTTFIRLRVVPVNDMPTIVNSGTPVQATEGQEFVYNIDGLDEEESASLNYQLVSTVPGNMTLSGKQIRWTPSNEDTIATSYAVQFVVRDTGQISSVAGTGSTTPLTSVTFTQVIFLNDVDSPAQQDSSYTPSIVTTEDELYTAKLRFADIDKRDVLRYTAPSAPGNLTIDERGADALSGQTGVVNIRWTPTMPGVYPIAIRVDSELQSLVRSTVFYNFTVTVLPKNDKPLINSTANVTINENSQYVYNLDISDEDDTSINLSFRETNSGSIVCGPKPAFLSLFASERKLIGTTNLTGFEDSELAQGNSPVTTYAICLEATDGQAVVTQDFKLSVIATNNAPAIQSMTSSTATATLYTANKTDLLNTEEPLLYNDPQGRKVILREGFDNFITMNFYNEEGDGPIAFALKNNPPNGVSMASSNSSSKTAVLTLTWKPADANVLAPPSFTVEATDNRNARTEFVFHTTVIDTPQKPSVSFNKTVQFIDEDVAQSIELGASDNDAGSVLSYSIVTNPADPHPAVPVYSSSVGLNPNLVLQLSNTGRVTFLPKIATPNITSAPSDAPVTFSICGTPRQVSGYDADCVSLTYVYRIQSRNDVPYFAPSFPTTSRTTAEEGKDYTGLSMHRVSVQTHCALLPATDVCVVDEESTTLAQIATSGEVRLVLRTPSAPPVGMLLSNSFPNCYPNTACLNNLPTPSCDAIGGCTSQLVYSQNLAWTGISFDQPASRSIVIRAEERIDTTKFSDFNFTLNITNVNKKPTINNGFELVPISMEEGSVLQFNLGALGSDPDNDPLVYSLPQGISGMVINTNTGLLTWNPNKSHLGKHVIEVGVTDVPPSSSSPLNYTTNLRISVTKRNNPPKFDPVLRSVADVSKSVSSQATQGILFTARIFARDEEGDDFSFFSNLSTLNGQPLPSAFNLSSFGTITWTPSNANVGPNTLIVSAKDSQPNGVVATQEYVLNVANINDPPVIQNPISGTLTISEGQTFARTYTVNDPDAADTRTFSVSGTRNLTISASGMLGIAPDANQAGNYTVSVQVKDLAGATDTNTFTLQVAQSNNPPVLEDVPQFTASRSQIFNFQLYAEDPESDAVRYFFVVKPNEASIEETTGKITILPPAVGETLTFQVFARDALNQASQTRTVVVKFVDNITVPRITSTPLAVGKIRSEYVYTPVIEPAGQYTIEVVSVADYILPKGMVISGGSLKWTPSLADIGVHKIMIRASTTIGNKEVKSDPQRYFLTINNLNNTPSLSYALDVGNQPIVSRDATEGIAFAQVVAVLTDLDIDDQNRLNVFFAGPLRSGQGSSNSQSKATAVLEAVNARLEGNHLKADLLLKWTPDNSAAFAVANGLQNKFQIQASDGVADSNILTVTFNVTNSNTKPFAYPDENQGTSEIAYVGKQYTREFFARDEDGQDVYFCLETPVNEASIKYPGFSFDATKNRFQIQGSGPTLTATNNMPVDTRCVKGNSVAPEQTPKPERGRLSKAKIVWDPIDRDIYKDTYADQPMVVYDNVNKDDSFNKDLKFTSKLAPSIDNLLPDSQFIGREVLISGGGIVSNENQLLVKFLRSDNSIVAVTSVYGIVTTGQGKFIVPKGAVSGFVSIGFTSYSEPVPFTVLNAETSQIAGYTTTDLLSSPSGVAVTYTADRQYVFVANKDYHSINMFEYTTAAGLVASRVIAGRVGTPGDLDGGSSVSLLNSPNGLSLMHYAGKPWLLIADTENNKIKVADLSDITLVQASRTYNYPLYTLSNSTHLHRPYKAIQHPTNSNLIYIANTFNNTIEQINLGGKSLTTFAQAPNVNTLAPSKLTTTVAGSGFARVDLLGNVFHPTDLGFKSDGSQLIVASYSNFKHSFNSSFKLFMKEMANRNNTTTPYAVEGTFQANDISVAPYFRTSIYDGDALMTAVSNRNEWSNSLGFSNLLSSPGNVVNRVDSAFFYSTNNFNLSTSPRINGALHALSVQQGASTTVISKASLTVQSREIEYLGTPGNLGYVDANNGKKGAVVSYPGSGEVAVTPARDETNFYEISGMSRNSLPAEIGNKELGIPTYYDLNEDLVDDLILPVPTLSKIFIFPGRVSQAQVIPVTFDTVNYWAITSANLGTNCGNTDCLNGANHIVFGRFVPAIYVPNTGAEAYYNAAEYTNIPILQGEDMAILNGTQNTIRFFDSYANTFDTTGYTNAKTALATYLLSESSLISTSLSYSAATTSLDTAVNNLSNPQSPPPTNAIAFDPRVTSGSCGAADPVTAGNYPSTIDSALETAICVAFAGFQTARTAAANAVAARNSSATTANSAQAVVALTAGVNVTNNPLYGNKKTYRFSLGLEGTLPSGAATVNLTNQIFILSYSNASPEQGVALKTGFSYLATNCKGGGGTAGGAIRDFTCLSSASSTEPQSDMDAAWPLFNNFYPASTNSTHLYMPVRYSSISFNSVRDQLVNVQQLAVKFKGTVNGSDVRILSMNTSKGVALNLVDSLLASGIKSKIYAGEAFSRVSFPPFGASSLRGAVQPYAVGTFLKADAVFFITRDRIFEGFEMVPSFSSGVYTEVPARISGASVLNALRYPKTGAADSNLVFDGVDFVMHDFNGDGATDLASIHPEDKKLIIRLGTGRLDINMLEVDDQNKIQVLDTLSNPVSIEAIQISTTAGVDLLVTNKDSDAVSLYKYNNKDRASNKLFRPAINYSLGEKGGLTAKGVYRTRTAYTGQSNQQSISAINATTESWSFLNHYIFGVPTANYDFYHTGPRFSQLATISATEGINLVITNADKGLSILGGFRFVQPNILNSTVSYFVSTRPTGLQVADLNGDGAEDLITTDFYFNRLTVVLSEKNLAGLVYDPESAKYPTLGMPLGAVAADFNEIQDSKGVNYPDIAVANFDKDQISIFYNGGESSNPSINPNFTFAHKGYPRLDLKVGNGPVSMAASDFNTDGHIDLVVANQIGNNICVLYNSATNPGTFADPVFYQTGRNPRHVLAIDIHDPSNGATPGLTDIVVLNQASESVTVLVNNGKGFNPPAEYRIGKYFPSGLKLLDAITEQPLDPFTFQPFKMVSGDFGNLTTSTTSVLTPEPKYKNLVVADETMIHNFKNIGDKATGTNRAALTRFQVGGDGSLSALAIVTMPADSVIKSLVVSQNDQVVYVRSSISDTIWQTNPLSIERTLYKTGYLETIALGAFNPGAVSTSATFSLTESSFNLRREELGGSLEGMQIAQDGKIYSAHSGTNKGVLRFNADGSSSQYVVGSIKQGASVLDFNPQFGFSISLNQPSGMTLDSNKSSLLVVDRGNQLLRIVDLAKNVTRTLLTGNDNVPVPIPNLVGITNVPDTFNYYALAKDRILFVNPSDSPVSVVTKTLDVAFGSGQDLFKIQSYQNFLYAGSRDAEEQPAAGTIYRIDTSKSPFENKVLLSGILGLNGFTINARATKLFYTEWQTYQIKMLDLSNPAATPVTLAGISSIQGIFDGSNRLALLNKPGDLCLNSKEDKLYFVDGPSIRQIDLSNLNTLNLSVSTVAGNPFDTGIIDEFGRRARFIQPNYLYYDFNNGKDILYVSDKIANNVRRIAIDP